MTLVAIGNIAHGDIGALLDIFGQRSAAADFQVVGMTAYCKYVHSDDPFLSRNNGRRPEKDSSWYPLYFPSLYRNG